MLCIIKDVGPLHLIKIETSQETSLGFAPKNSRGSWARFVVNVIDAGEATQIFHAKKGACQ